MTENAVPDPAAPEPPKTPAERAGVGPADYRRWASGGSVSDEVRAKIKAAAPNEPGRRVVVGGRGAVSGIEEFERPKPEGQ